MTETQLIRHFTATGFVVDNDSLLLHWHPKVEAWLPPGGHVEPNEDPVQAVLREIREETGIKAEIVSENADFGFDYPKLLPAPYTIMVEDIEDSVDGRHQHIDMIYFCRPGSVKTPLSGSWRWVTRRALADAVSLQVPDGVSAPPPLDVRLLAEQAFRAVERSAGTA